MTIPELTFDEIEFVKEGLCEACKGVFWMHESDCYKKCEAFQKDAAEIRAIVRALAKGKGKPCRVKRDRELREQSEAEVAALQAALAKVEGKASGGQ